MKETPEHSEILEPKACLGRVWYVGQHAPIWKTARSPIPHFRKGQKKSKSGEG